MSILSDKELHDLAAELFAAANNAAGAAMPAGAAGPPTAAVAFYVKVRDIAKAIKEKIEKSPEWELQEKLSNPSNKTALEKAMNKAKLDCCEVRKSINYQESCPRFDIDIKIKPTEMAKWLKDIKNTKANFTSRFLQVLDDLNIAKKSTIGKVTVIVQ